MNCLYIEKIDEHLFVKRKEDDAILSKNDLWQYLYHWYCNKYTSEKMCISPEELKKADVTYNPLSEGWQIIDFTENTFEALRQHRFVTLNIQELTDQSNIEVGTTKTIKKRMPWYENEKPFIYFFSDEPFGGELSTETRLYFNVKPNNVVEFISTITATLNKYAIPFHLKTLYECESERRSDNTVLYFSNTHAATIFIALQTVKDKWSCWLNDTTPLFTKKLLNGVSFAESPLFSASFGVMISTFLIDTFEKMLYQKDINSATWYALLQEHLLHIGYNGDINACYKRPDTYFPYMFELLTC